MTTSMQNIFSRMILGFALCLTLAGCDQSASKSAEPPVSAQATPRVQQVVAKQGGKLSFNRDIRPILSDKCFFCHGPDPETREADLRIDLADQAKRDLGGYSAIVPGDREASELWLRITDTLDPMPPKKIHKNLTAEQIETLGRWIDEGAEYETHWAYEPLSRPGVPEVANADWPGNAIDRFILARLEAEEVDPSPQATRRQLLRRVTFDLTGLPPTPEQAKRFLADQSPQAYERYVDSLLEEPAYGEHLAVWWLDLVRYADTKGLHGDQERPAWAYRDWVIKSLNANMPFDRFTIMQLAGDLMQPEPTRDMLIASAYNRLSSQTEEGGAQHKEYEAIYNTDRVTNYGEVWLGSSTGCAQCHDHKFDPITAEDFYSLAAFFADINQQIIGHRSGYALNSPPFTFVPQDEEQAKKIAEHEQTYREFINQHPYAMVIEERLTSRDYIPPTTEPDPEAKAYEEQLKKLLEERANLAKQVPVVISTRALATPRTVRILHRGNWQDETGRIVQPAAPSFLNGPASTEEDRLDRLDLAKWTVSKQNPLTARAIVNRLWGKYLGSPLSKNTLDLGSQGTAPTHPGLLDYLAVEFRESWDLRQVIRMIVTSETYKQSANARPDLAEIDPNNKQLFARQSATRLPAEAIRDQALRVSGLLKRRLGGPSVLPYQPDGVWEPLNFPRRKYNQSKGDDLYRRSVYTWVQRTFPHPMMSTFDAPSRESCTGERLVSATPLQSLSMLNGPIFVESARVLAADLVRQQASDEDRLNTLFERVLIREPRASERKTLLAMLERQRAHFKQSPDDAKALISVGESPVAQDLDPVQVAAWTSLCRVALNLHETITRN